MKDVLKENLCPIEYDEPGIPIYLKAESLSDFTDKKLLGFYMDYVQWFYITSGKPNFVINGETISLGTGDVLMINSNQISYGYSPDNSDVKFIRLIFSPEIFFGSSALVDKYVSNFTNKGHKYYIFKSNNSNGVEFARLIKNAYDFKTNTQFLKEFEIINILKDIWKRMLILYKAQGKQPVVWDHEDLILLKDMIQFIQTNYSEKISLDDIGHSANTSRSTCCKIFKKYLATSPNDYLNAFRMGIAVNLLKSTELSISDIADYCGFNHLSYFSKSFYDLYGEKPTRYRKAV